MRGERNSGSQDNAEVISAGRWSVSPAFKNHLKWAKRWLELSGKLMTDLNLCSKGPLKNKSPQGNALGCEEWCKSEPEGSGTQGCRLCLPGHGGEPTAPVPPWPHFCFGFFFVFRLISFCSACETAPEVIIIFFLIFIFIFIIDGVSR